MSQLAQEVFVTEKNFEEESYLKHNHDVAIAVLNGTIPSGLWHFNTYGKNENRKINVLTPNGSKIKRIKLAKIESILKNNIPMQKTDHLYDFLTESVKQQFNIVDTSNISSNNYDPYTLALIEKHKNGIILDCGAGNRTKYYDNVVNFEIVAYASTDVRGVAEELPFLDNSFDAVISIAVLEHVKDPFLAAKEIKRVLKPGGDIICSVPFLQPLHGYPHHYYNMTHEGLKNLFEDEISINKIEVLQSLLPIWSLTWIVSSWASGLTGQAKDEFMNLKIKDLMEPAETYLDRLFVCTLSNDKNFELASGTVLFGSKKIPNNGLDQSLKA